MSEIFNNKEEGTDIKLLIILFFIVGMVFFIIFLQADNQKEIKHIITETCNQTPVHNNLDIFCTQRTGCSERAEFINETSNRILCECRGVIYVIWGNIMGAKSSYH